MCNVRKRTSVHESRSMFRCLHQIGRKSVLQQHGDSAGNAQIFHRERLVVNGKSQKNILDAAAQVVFILGKAQDSHYLRCRSNVEARLARDAVRLASQSCNDVSQAAVVHIKHTVPQHILQRKAIVLVLIHVIVKQCSNHVVSRCYRMKISRKVQVDLIHRKHLRISSAGSSALHAEARTERRFTKRTYSFLSDLVQPQSQADRYGRLSDTGFCGRNCSNKYQVAVFHPFLIDQRFRNLCYITSVI